MMSVPCAKAMRTSSPGTTGRVALRALRATVSVGTSKRSMSLRRISRVSPSGSERLRLVLDSVLSVPVMISPWRSMVTYSPASQPGAFTSAQEMAVRLSTRETSNVCATSSTVRMVIVLSVRLVIVPATVTRSM